MTKKLTAARRSVRARAAPAPADSKPKPALSAEPSRQAGRASEPPLPQEQQPLQPEAGRQHGAEPESPGLETSTRLGRCFQCVVPSSPVAAPRSIAIPASEAVWIGTQVLPEGMPGLPAAAAAPASEHARCAPRQRLTAARPRGRAAGLTAAAQAAAPCCTPPQAAWRSI